MKYTKSIVAALAIACTLASCDDFGDINDNPNYPTEGSTYAQFLYSSRFVKYFVCNSYYYDIWTQEYPGYLSESKNSQYGPLDCTVQFESDFFYYNAIKQLNNIIELNTNESTKSETAVTTWGSNANQIAIARTLRAFYYMSMTDVLGPIPYTESMKGASEGNWTPAFDNTDVVYAGLDADLQEAYALFDESTGMNAADYDIFYAGDISKWKKFNASLRMMMAIKMKDVDPSNGATRFAKAYADGGMESYDDSFTYTYDNNSSDDVMNLSPMYSTAYGIGSGNQNHVPSKTIVDALKAYNDPRIFTYCDVSETAYKGKAGAYGSADQRSYRGVPFGLSSNAEVNSQSKYCASVGAKYCVQTATYGVITTARTLLVEAEAALLGWINADAESLYKAGIKSSFEFEGYLEQKNAGGSFNYDFDSYYAQDNVQLSQTKDTALKQIVFQRWLAGYLCDGVEAWADWRINNVPDIPVYQGQIDNGHLTYPNRMCYYTSEIASNTAQYEAAVAAYLKGGDDRWKSRIWWDVADNTSSVGTLETDDEIASYSPVTWTQVGTGTYNYVLDMYDYAFQGGSGINPTSVSGLAIYQQNEDPTIWKIEGYGAYTGSYTLLFTVASDGTISVPITERLSLGSLPYSIGVMTYDVYVASYASSEDYDSSVEALTGVSKKDGNTFTFYLCDVITNYYAPYYTIYADNQPETFVIDGSSASARKRNYVELDDAKL